MMAVWETELGAKCPVKALSAEVTLTFGIAERKGRGGGLKKSCTTQDPQNVVIPLVIL